MASEREVQEIKKRHAARLLSQPGVSGVGIEKDQSGQYVLTIHVDDPSVCKNIPSHIEGQPVKIVPTGPFRKIIR